MIFVGNTCESYRKDMNISVLHIIIKITIS